VALSANTFSAVPADLHMTIREIYKTCCVCIRIEASAQSGRVCACVRVCVCACVRAITPYNALIKSPCEPWQIRARRRRL